MTPIANKSLKDEYAAYCADCDMLTLPAASYERWLEGTLNACRLDLANAQAEIADMRNSLIAYGGAVADTLSVMPMVIPEYPQWQIASTKLHAVIMAELEKNSVHD